MNPLNKCDKSKKGQDDKPVEFRLSMYHNFVDMGSQTSFRSLVSHRGYPFFLKNLISLFLFFCYVVINGFKMFRFGVLSAHTIAERFLILKKNVE